jgi:hypothetical protein
VRGVQKKKPTHVFPRGQGGLTTTIKYWPFARIASGRGAAKLIIKKNLPLEHARGGWVSRRIGLVSAVVCRPRRRHCSPCPPRKQLLAGVVRGAVAVGSGRRRRHRPPSAPPCRCCRPGVLALAVPVAPRFTPRAVARGSGWGAVAVVLVVGVGRAPCRPAPGAVCVGAGVVVLALLWAGVVVVVPSPRRRRVVGGFVDPR